MPRVVSIGAHQVKVRPRPLVGTKTFVRATERDMRDYEWSESFCPNGRPFRSDPRAGLKWRKQGDTYVQNVARAIAKNLPLPPVPALRSVTVKSGNSCAFRSGDYRCALDITRVVEAWDPRRGIWVPEIRVCHLHAIEYVTGEKVFMPTFAQQQVAMLELGA